jgi:hypothetical protein
MRLALPQPSDPLRLLRRHLPQILKIWGRQGRGWGGAPTRRGVAGLLLPLAV